MPVRMTALMPGADPQPVSEIEAVLAALESEKAAEVPVEPAFREFSDVNRRLELIGQIFRASDRGADAFKGIRAVFGEELTDEECAMVCRKLRLEIAHEAPA